MIILGSLWIDSGNEIRRDILEEFLSHSLGEDCARDPHQRQKYAWFGSGADRLAEDATTPELLSNLKLW